MQPSEQQQFNDSTFASRQRDAEPTSPVGISVISATTPRSVRKRTHHPSSSSEGSGGDDEEEDDEADAKDGDDSETITRAPASGAFRGKCLYQSRKCENERALKRNGKAHNLCEEHRSKQNQHQRKFDAKKFTRKRRKSTANQADETDENDHQYRSEVVYYDHDRQPYTYQRRSSAGAIPGLYEVTNMAAPGPAMLHGPAATSSYTGWPVKPEPTRRHSYMDPSTRRAYLEPRQTHGLESDYYHPPANPHRPSLGYPQPPQPPMLRPTSHQGQALFPIRPTSEAAYSGHLATTEVASRYAPLDHHLVRSSSDYTPPGRALPTYSQSELRVASSLVPQRQYSPEGSGLVHLRSHAALQDDPQQMLRAMHHNRRPLDIRVSRESPVATSHGHDLSFSPLGGRKLPSLHVTTGPPTSVYAPPLAASSPIVAITMRPAVSRSSSPPVRLTGGPILPSLAPIHPRSTST